MPEPERTARARDLKYDLVIFDLDGTLVDSRADLAAAVNRVLRAMALPELPFEVVCGFIGEGARRLLQRSLGPSNECRVDEALASFFADYGEHLLDRTRPYPGVPEVLRALADLGLALTVATNKPEAMSRAILDGLGLLPLFSGLVGGDTLGVRKPDPAAVFELTGRAAVPRERTLFVGDSGIDVETARVAGVAFCGVAWGIRPGDLRAAGVPTIEAAAELLDVVRRGVHPAGVLV